MDIYGEELLRHPVLYGKHYSHPEDVDYNKYMIDM